MSIRSDIIGDGRWCKLLDLDVAADASVGHLINLVAAIQEIIAGSAVHLVGALSREYPVGSGSGVDGVIVGRRICACRLVVADIEEVAVPGNPAYLVSCPRCRKESAGRDLIAKDEIISTISGQRVSAGVSNEDVGAVGVLRLVFVKATSGDAILPRIPIAIWPIWSWLSSCVTSTNWMPRKL
nr:hypothetical protein [Bradyrhizobium sp. AUGA SZCCT0283]